MNKFKFAKGTRVVAKGIYLGTVVSYDNTTKYVGVKLDVKVAGEAVYFFPAHEVEVRK